MDKGIRLECNKKFAEQLPMRENTRTGNRNFRAAIITHLMESFGCTLASAATHYNHSFIEARKASATNPDLAKLLEGLGRPEDKKGGRKSNKEKAAAAGTIEDYIEPIPELFLVKKSKGGEQVGEPCTFEEAKALVEAAKLAKKAKLFWIAA